MRQEETVITPRSNLLPYLRGLEAAPPRQVLLWGQNDVHVTAVRFAAYAALHTMPVLVVDGANAFDPYEVARLAARQSQDPEPLLKSVRVARAFTCYQLREMVFRLGKQLTDQRSLVVVMGLCTMFFDDDVSHSEAASLFYQTWWKLVELRRQGVPLLIAQSLSPVNARRMYFLDDLYALSEVVLRVAPGQHTTRRSMKETHQLSLPPLAGDPALMDMEA